MSARLSNAVMKIADIFKEGSEARARFARYYALVTIGVIIVVLVLLAIATRG